jgi:hypothetical protein
VSICCSSVWAWIDRWPNLCPSLTQAPSTEYACSTAISTVQTRGRHAWRNCFCQKLKAQIWLLCFMFASNVLRIPGVVLVELKKSCLQSNVKDRLSIPLVVDCCTTYE